MSSLIIVISFEGTSSVAGLTSESQSGAAGGVRASEIA